MSGGTFNHQEAIISVISSDLEYVIENNDDSSKDEYGFRRGKGYSKETLERLDKLAKMCDICFSLVKSADYLLADDTTEEGFQKSFDKRFQGVKEWAK